MERRKRSLDGIESHQSPCLNVDLEDTARPSKRLALDLSRLSLNAPAEERVSASMAEPLSAAPTELSLKDWVESDAHMSHLSETTGMELVQYTRPWRDSVVVISDLQAELAQLEREESLNVVEKRSQSRYSSILRDLLKSPPNMAKVSMDLVLWKPSPFSTVPRTQEGKEGKEEPEPPQNMDAKEAPESSMDLD